MNKCIAIIGIGLVGGSIGLSLKKKVKKVIGLDKNKEIINLALSRGAINNSINNISELKEADVIIIALYPEDTIKFILDNKNIWTKKQLLLDVSGLKKNIVYLLQKELKNTEFLGTHPIVGREEKGFKMARKDLFSNSTFILTPTKKNSIEKVKLAKNILNLLGSNNIYDISSKIHDKIISYTSHLPHIISCAYMHNYNKNKNKYKNKMLGGSFFDISRVSKINEDLWSELLLTNKEENISNIDDLIKKLKDIKEILNNNNKSKMRLFLKKARKIKEGI